MLGWWKQRKQRREEDSKLHRLDRAELRAAINNLDHRRNNVELLMQRMLEERQSA